MYKTKYHLGSHFQACQLGTKIFPLVTDNSDQFVFERAHTLIMADRWEKHRSITDDDTARHTMS